MKIKYREIKLGAARLDVLTQINAIVKTYQKQGYVLNNGYPDRYSEDDDE